MGGAVSPQSESAEGRALEGSGTESDPYQIGSAEELRDFAKLVNEDGKTTANAILTDDIDLNPGFTFKEDGRYSGPDGEEPHQWTPIGTSINNPYEGNFNGAGHTISGLYINRSDSDQGLFGYVSGSGKIEKLTVSGSVSGGMYVGGIAGQNGGRITDCAFSGSVSGVSFVGGVVGVVGDSSASVENCYNTGAVSGSGLYVGGVVGLNGGSVENCYNTGSVNGSAASSNVGGVVGNNFGGTVKNCYNTGTVTGTDDSVGGVVGYNSSNGTVENCYNTGAVSGSGLYVGGVVGYNFIGGSVKNCYNTGEVIGSSVGGVVGYNSSSGNVTNCYNTGEVSGSSDYSYIGGVVGNNDGTVTDCYFLQQGELPGIGDGSGTAGATGLTADQFKDQNSFTSWTDFANTWEIKSIFGRPTLKDNAEIGGTANNPYKIFTATQLAAFRDLVNRESGNPAAWAVLMENITLNSNEEWEPIGTSESTAYTGTFDGNGKTISGLYIDSSTNNQGLFGYVGSGGIVKDLSVSGSVSGNRNVGGVVGYNTGGTVTGCIFSGSGTVTGTGDYVGGVVGYNGGIVENCYNTGTGSVNGSADSRNVGGVVGYSSGSVKNCYNTISVSGNSYVGGVVGDNRGPVENCYNTGSVTVTGSGGRVGGVVGFNIGPVKNCYNTGKVTGSSDYSYIGGVVGQNFGGIVANCYYQIDKGAKVGIGDTTADDTTTVAKTAEQFASGEVAWLLQAGQKAAGEEDPIPQVWGQSNLTTPDSWPTLVALDKNAKTVYKVITDYGYVEQPNDVSYTNNPAKPAAPAREGYTFGGWDKTGEGTTTITYTAKWTENAPDPDPEPTPEPEPEEPPYTGKYSYELTTSVGDHGSLTVDRYATEGDKVTIDVTPDQAYKLDELVVTANGKDVELTANSDGTYSFTMPSADVKITATFAEDPDWTEPEPEPSTDVSDLFSDIARDAWYKDAVQYAYDNGLMTGVSDTEFAPEATTTRAMIVSILARLENVTTAEAAGFADVDDEWYATAVNWAANVGVVNGYEDNTFQPNTAITREQLAAILMNYAAYKGEDVSNRADLANYTDQPSTWAQEAMQWAVAEGLISGVTNDELQPQGNATRAQVAAILQRLLEA